MTRIESAIIVAAIATILLLTFSAVAAEPEMVAVDECAQSSDMTRYAWCNLAASHVAELSGDLRTAILQVDTAAQYLGSSDAVTTRSIELRAALGAQYLGFAREAVYRCSSVKSMPKGSLRTRAVAACKTAIATVQNRR